MGRNNRIVLNSGFVDVPAFLSGNPVTTLQGTAKAGGKGAGKSHPSPGSDDEGNVKALDGNPTR